MADTKTTASKPRKRFIGSKSSTPSKTAARAVLSNQIPDEIWNDKQLNNAINQLPANYSFEVHKTIHHIRKNNATMVALQMPEGLQMFACTIADIIEQFTSASTVILGDVTYGACCIDDYTAVALGCDMLVHYGHSCLVPIDQTRIKTLYVFVEISIDSVHLAQTVRWNFPNDQRQFHERILSLEYDDSKRPAGSPLDSRTHIQLEGHTETDCPGTAKASPTQPTRLALVSTIQFAASLQRLKEDLVVDVPTLTGEANNLLPEAPSESSSLTKSMPQYHTTFWTGKYDVTIPRSKPLSPGEILGCTAPRLGDVDTILYLGDGRFHLESIMIANPTIPAFRYDPYAKKLTRERYGHQEMQSMRNDAIQSAKKSIESAPQQTSLTSPPVWGLIFGTLGRQGSLKQLQAITKQLDTSRTTIPYIQILLSELSPAKLSLFYPHVSTFVQTSCPRLSIDWGYAFDRPLLSPYETAVALGAAAAGWMDESESKGKIGEYPMDFYEGGSPWAIARLNGRF
ncbi:hypothetical protein AX17_001059 [Amanita inopinata Kibby_2008]|nr:hypothetical protein AX17_001059 [Amanita inopinata Kibby_2008]